MRSPLVWMLISPSRFPIYNKTILFVGNFHRRNRYVPTFSAAGAVLATRIDLLQMRLIAFADAGFCPLKDPQITDGAFRVLGEAIDRDGPIPRRGYFLGRRCVEIDHVFRRSLPDERRAAISAADQALRLQMFLAELITGKYDIALFSPPKEYHLRNPFAPPPSDSNSIQGPNSTRSLVCRNCEVLTCRTIACGTGTMG